MSNLVILFAHRVAIVVGLRDVRNCVVKISVEPSSTCLSKQRWKLLVFTATIHVNIAYNTLHFLGLLELSYVGEFQRFNFQLNFCWLHNIAILLQVLIELGKFVVDALETFFYPRIKRIPVIILFFLIVAHRNIRQRPFRKWVGGRCSCISLVKFVFAVTGHVLTVRVIDFRKHFSLLLLLNLADWEYITFNRRILQKMINPILVIC